MRKTKNIGCLSRILILKYIELFQFQHPKFVIFAFRVLNLLNTDNQFIDQFVKMIVKVARKIFITERPE